MRSALDDDTFGAELAEGDAELEPDIAAADDTSRSGHLVQRQGLGRGDDLAAERQEGQFDRLEPVARMTCSA
jgi:hypothetical protein